MSVSLQILQFARAKGWAVTTAESCTGGMVAAAITDVAGSSAVFQRGYVTYSNAAKVEMLGVSQFNLDTYGAVSEAVAADMAEGARRAANADAAIAITGIAGPGGSEHKPEGRVCFGLATKSDISTETVEFGALGRHAVRHAARDHALNVLLSALKADAS